MGVRCGGECISQNIVSVTYFPAKVIIQTQSHAPVKYSVKPEPGQEFV